MFSKRDELPEGMTRLPIKTVHLNKSPMVMGNLKTLSKEMATRWGLDLDQAMNHAQSARDLADMSGIWPDVFKRPQEGTPDVDEDLYGGFVGNADRRRLNDVRKLDGPAFAKARFTFEDPRLQELVFRYRARNFPSSLSAEEQVRWNEHRAARLLEGEGGFKSIDAYFAEIDSLSESADERGEALLGALYDWAERIVPEHN